MNDTRLLSGPDKASCECREKHHIKLSVDIFVTEASDTGVLTFDDDNRKLWRLGGNKMVRHFTIYLALLGSLAWLTAGCGDEVITVQADAASTQNDTTSSSDTADDVGSGPCAGKGEGEACDDGDPCTLDDVCTGGVCVGGSNDPCSSDNPCEVGTCVEGEGCQYEALEDGSQCEASCFEVATCQSGECKDGHL